jgi:integrase
MIFSIHTAQRQGTIIRAKWENIDFEKKLWTISKEDMKMKREHKVPLSDIMIKYLKELKEYSGDGVYLFPNSQEKATRNKNPFISNNTANQSLRNMGFTNQQQTAHGLRAMFKTVCKEHQESDNLKNEFVERILAHKVDGEIEAYYNRAENIEDMRKVVEWWSNWLES